MTHLPKGKRLLDAERRSFARFATRHAEPVFRDVSRHLYERWDELNRRYFKRKLKRPHLTFGYTSPRSLAFCSPLTDWGATLQITINQRLILGDHRIVVNPWPAQGVKRFLADVLLHESLHQYHREVTGKTDPGYRGHGTAFAQTCNDIGDQLGLPPVVARRRNRAKDLDKPICNYWPHNVRPPDFYSPDIDTEVIVARRVKPRHVPNDAIFIESLRALLDEHRYSELREALDAELARLGQGQWCIPIEATMDAFDLCRLPS
ncbi:MAG: hypothetical protein HY372_02835 [Candidatus Andersenbacteria bacterium]|nr:hypothetical protein [Candidatus Andersenbacteria bacterium]